MEIYRNKLSPIRMQQGTEYIKKAVEYDNAGLIHFVFAHE